MSNKGRPSSGRIVKSATLKVRPDAWEKFQALAKKMGVTRSRLVEKIADKEVSLSTESQVLAASMGECSNN